MTLTECRWCGMTHGPMCSSVKAIEYYPDGAVRRVEFRSASDYAQVNLGANIQSSASSHSSDPKRHAEHQ